MFKEKLIIRVFYSIENRAMISRFIGGAAIQPLVCALEGPGRVLYSSLLAY